MMERCCCAEGSLSDYESLLQVLFGEETRESLKLRLAIKQAETVEVYDTLAVMTVVQFRRPVTDLKTSNGRAHDA